MESLLNQHGYGVEASIVPVWIISQYWPNVDLQSNGYLNECEKLMFKFKLDLQKNDKTIWKLEPL